MKKCFCGELTKNLLLTPSTNNNFPELVGNLFFFNKESSKFHTYRLTVPAVP